MKALRRMPWYTTPDHEVRSICSEFWRDLLDYQHDADADDEYSSTHKGCTGGCELLEYACLRTWLRDCERFGPHRDEP